MSETILHKWGVKFIILIIVILIGVRLFHKKIKNQKSYKIFLDHSLLAASISIGFVFLLKKSNPILCPWDLNEFSGSKHFVSFFQIFNNSLPVAKCFPGGHSSAAYAWIAFYFSNQLITGKRNYKFLLPGLLLGIVYGVAQQSRGAHFLSHDFATLFLCWIISGAVALLFKKVIDN